LIVVDQIKDVNKEKDQRYKQHKKAQHWLLEQIKEKRKIERLLREKDGKIASNIVKKDKVMFKNSIKKALKDKNTQNREYRQYLNKQIVDKMN